MPEKTPIEAGIGREAEARWRDSRDTSKASNPQARAPKTADIRLTAHAGLGWP